MRHILAVEVSDPSVWNVSLAFTPAAANRIPRYGEGITLHYVADEMANSAGFAVVRLQLFCQPPKHV
jgi:hypothetical protein